MRCEVCEAKKVASSTSAATRQLYAAADKPLTMNGVHLLDHGERLVAEVIAKELLGGAKTGLDPQQFDRLRSATLDKNYYWYSRYRVVDGYNVLAIRN